MNGALFVIVAGGACRFAFDDYLMVALDSMLHGISLVKLEGATFGRDDALRWVHAAMARDEVAHKCNDHKVGSRLAAEHVDAQHDSGDGDVERGSKDAQEAKRGHKARIASGDGGDPPAKRGADAKQGRDLSALVARAQSERGAE